jgi:hypothetical protein
VCMFHRLYPASRPSRLFLRPVYSRPKAFISGIEIELRRYVRRKAHTFRGLRKMAENPALTADICPTALHIITITMVSTAVCNSNVWREPARESCGGRYLDCKEFDSCHRSIVHIVQPNVHSLIWRIVSRCNLCHHSSWQRRCGPLLGSSQGSLPASSPP